LAVENYLRSEMRTFFCDNYEDRKHLEAMANSFFGTHNTTYVVSPFFDRPFDVSSKRAIPTQVCKFLNNKIKALNNQNILGSDQFVGYS